MRYAVVFGIIGSMMLSSCSDTPPKLRDLYDPYAGPGEFAISPNLELENAPRFGKPTSANPWW